jgi:hypothetical protein
VAELEILPWWQTQVLALRVYPSPSRPHHLIREGPAAGIDVRVLGVAVREAGVGT